MEDIFLLKYVLYAYLCCVLNYSLSLLSRTKQRLILSYTVFYIAIIKV